VTQSQGDRCSLQRGIPFDPVDKVPALMTFSPLLRQNTSTLLHQDTSTLLPLLGWVDWAFKGDECACGKNRLMDLRAKKKDPVSRQSVMLGGVDQWMLESEDWVLGGTDKVFEEEKQVRVWQELADGFTSEKREVLCGEDWEVPVCSC
jgi:hypothetical protein